MPPQAYVGVLECDLLLGDVHSLKQKRAVLRPILARLRRMQISASEIGYADLHRRAGIGIAVVSGDAGTVGRVLDEAERTVAGEVEVELLGVHRRLFGPGD
jgi:uncharacterized protein YlxP (DUF503 family)